MKTKKLALFLLPRIALLTACVAPVWIVGHLLGVPEVVIGALMLVVNLTFARFQEDLVDRIVPRFGVTQLNGR